jgi:hypothetical protein
LRRIELARKLETPCPCGSGKNYKQCCLPKTRQTLDEVERILPELQERLHEFLLQEEPEMLASFMQDLADDAPWLQVEPESLDGLFEICPYLQGSLLDWLVREDHSIFLGEVIQAFPFFHGGHFFLKEFRSNEARLEEMSLLEALEKMNFSLYRILGREGANLDVEDVFAERQLCLHNVPWELEKGDYALISSFTINGAIPIQIAYKIMSRHPAEEGQQLEGILRQLYAEYGKGTFEDFMRKSYGTIYWFISGCLLLNRCYELFGKSYDTSKLGHGALIYKYRCKMEDLEKFLQAACQEQDKYENWIRIIDVPYSSRLLVYCDEGALFIDYYHQDATHQVQKFLAPIAHELELVDRSWESFPTVLTLLPQKLWRDPFCITYKELLLNLLQLDLYHQHLALAEEELQLPIQANTLKDLSVDPPSRFFLALYLDQFEDAFQQYLPPELRFNFDALRKELGAPRQALDWPKYANVLQRAVKWLEREGYGWEEQSQAAIIWRTFAPRALPDLGEPKAWAAAIAAMACRLPPEALFPRLSKSLGVSQKAIRERYHTILLCLSIEQNFHQLLPDEPELSPLENWELGIAAEYSQLMEKIQELIDNDEALKYMLATVLAGIMDIDNSADRPRLAMLSFFYTLCVHEHVEIGNTILGFLEPILVPKLTPQEVSLYEELASLTLQVMVCQGEQEKVFCNLEGGQPVPLPEGFQAEEGALALNLVLVREGKPIIFSSLLLAEEFKEEFATFVQQTYWNWRKENPRGEYETFIKQQGYLLLAWMTE